MNLSILGLVRAVERAASTGERIVLDVGDGKKLALVSVDDLARLRSRGAHGRHASRDLTEEEIDLLDLTEDVDLLEAESNWESEGGAANEQESRAADDRRLDHDALRLDRSRGRRELPRPRAFAQAAAFFLRRLTTDFASVSSTGTVASQLMHASVMLCP